MEELIDKLEQLKLEISKSREVRLFLKKKEEIFEDKKLISLIEKYKNYPDDKLKKKILESSSFLDYKKSENEVNFIILRINQAFKKIRGNYDCR